MTFFFFASKQRTLQHRRSLRLPTTRCFCCLQAAWGGHSEKVMQEKSWGPTFQHSWLCAERLCWGVHRCLLQISSTPHWAELFFQVVVKSSQSSWSGRSLLLEWLPPGWTHSHHHEVLWEAIHASHQVCPRPAVNPYQFAFSSNRSTNDAEV